MTNNEQSTLAERYGKPLLIGAGEENSIAATKTLTATVMALLCWAMSVGEASGRLAGDAADALRMELAQVPRQIESLWQPEFLPKIIKLTQRLMEVNHFVLLSKGALTLVLPEGGLKLTETSQNIVYTDNTESFKHGPKVMLAGIAGQHPNAVYVVPPTDFLAEQLYKDLRSHFWIDPFGPEQQLAFQDDRVFFITFEDNPPIPQVILEELSVGPEKILTLPRVTRLQSIFLTLVTFQLISYHLAILKGENPDNPALDKAVTE